MMRGGIAMAGSQNARLERKKFFSDPILVGMIVVLLIFLSLFILYPFFVMFITAFRSNAETTDMYFLHILPVPCRLKRSYL